MRNRVVHLMGEKQAKEGRPITASVVARETGLTRAAISKWVRGEVVEFREDIIERLCVYFNCDIGDLLYLERSKPQGEGTNSLN